MFTQDTIVALSSGAVPSAIAVIRASGPAVSRIMKMMVQSRPDPRKACLTEFVTPFDAEIIDRGIVLFFPGPGSYTGEDSLEFHVHGGAAVVARILDSMCHIDGVRLAEAGEFSRRAFENGKLDLTEIDGIADLVSSETEQQRRLALRQSRGSLRTLYDDWRTRLVHIRAMIEAEFDFSDEEDVPDEIAREGVSELEELCALMHSHLADGRIGEIIRDGFRVSLMGLPNAGKSSLLNVLAKRDVAIVTEQAGTTRDVLDVSLDLDGFKVIVSDTAGLRETDDAVEAEGIRRANLAGDQSDLILWLHEAGSTNHVTYQGDTPMIGVTTKIDLSPDPIEGISVVTGEGIGDLLDLIMDRVRSEFPGSESGLISRQRYRLALEEALGYLEASLGMDGKKDEFRAENIRLAAECIGRITGRIDVEDLLDVIFSEFCVGK